MHYIFWKTREIFKYKNWNEELEVTIRKDVERNYFMEYITRYITKV